MKPNYASRLLDLLKHKIQLVGEFMVFMVIVHTLLFVPYKYLKMIMSLFYALKWLPNC